MQRRRHHTACTLYTDALLQVYGRGGTGGGRWRAAVVVPSAQRARRPMRQVPRLPVLRRRMVPPLPRLLRLQQCGRGIRVCGFCRSHGPRGRRTGVGLGRRRRRRWRQRQLRSTRSRECRALHPRRRPAGPIRGRAGCLHHRPRVCRRASYCRHAGRPLRPRCGRRMPLAGVVAPPPRRLSTQPIAVGGIGAMTGADKCPDLTRLERGLARRRRRAMAAGTANENAEGRHRAAQERIRDHIGDCQACLHGKDGAEA